MDDRVAGYAAVGFWFLWSFGFTAYNLKRLVETKSWFHALMTTLWIFVLASMSAGVLMIRLQVVIQK